MSAKAVWKPYAVISICMLLLAISAPLLAQNSRTLQGQVVKSDDQPLPGAVVKLKNMKTQAIRSFVSDNTGNYRFTSLSTNVDYEVYAEFQSSKSATKTLSAFDSRSSATINLKVNAK